MRLPSTPPSESGVFTTDFLPSSMSQRGFVRTTSSISGDPTMVATRSSTTPSCLSSGCRSSPLCRGSQHADLVHNRSEWGRTSSPPSTSTKNAAHTTLATSTSMGANGSGRQVVSDPPRHTRPLYSSIPLPHEDIDLHPTLDYDSHNEACISDSCFSTDNKHWFAPATTPLRGCLTIVLPSTRQKMTVCPSSSPTHSYCGVVTVWDVLVAIEMVMNRLDSTDDTCIRQIPSKFADRRGRRCVCRGDIPSLEYLRQRYGRAGLTKVEGDEDVFMLHVGKR